MTCWQRCGDAALVFISSLMLFVGCGGNPVGGKLPRPNGAKVAAGAAVIATALTLANPDLAGKKPESRNDPAKSRGVRVESVPMEVLDRSASEDGSDSELHSDAVAQEPPCPANSPGPKGEPAPHSGVPLIPLVPVSRSVVGSGPRAKCRDGQIKNDNDGTSPTESPAESSAAPSTSD